MTQINLFIPSRDRSCQLHLLLESLKKNFHGQYVPHIMYTYSTEFFKQGYDRLIDSDLGKDCIWVKELHAASQFYRFLRECTYVGLFTDDSVFYRESPFKADDITSFLDAPNIWCVSLRLGQNIVICDYVTNKPDTFPLNTTMGSNFYKYDYRQYKDYWCSYFSLPTSYDGCFYRAEDLLFLANGVDFGPIFLWEREICHNDRHKLSPKHDILFPLKSCVFAQQINSTHNYGFRTSGSFNASTYSLNEKYLDGYTISLESMNVEKINSAHAEIPFSFTK